MGIPVNREMNRAILVASQALRSVSGSPRSSGARFGLWDERRAKDSAGWEERRRRCGDLDGNEPSASLRRRSDPSGTRRGNSSGDPRRATFDGPRILLKNDKASIKTKAGSSRRAARWSGRGPDFLGGRSARSSRPARGRARLLSSAPKTPYNDERRKTGVVDRPFALESLPK